MENTAKELTTRLREENIRLVLNDNNIEVVSYEKELSNDLIQEIKLNKQDLIKYLQSIEHSEGTSPIIPVINLSTNYSLSDAQKRLWVLSQYEGTSLAYNMPSSVRLKGGYDIEKLKRAIFSTVNRHEILRTIFKEDSNGEIRQWILPLEELNLKIDFKDYREQDTNTNIVDTYIKEDSQRPFDLEKGPLLRVAILQISDTEYVFYYNMHHIISDGWSMDVLSKDVLTYYEAFVKGITPNLPELRIQYKDYSSWQLSQLDTKMFNEDKKYWLENLSGELSLLNLPTDKQRPRIKTYNGRSLRTFISSTITDKLKSFTRDRGGSLFMGALSALNILLNKYTSEEDVIIGTPIAGRDQLDLENQIGFYLNVLALRNQVSGEDTFEEFFDKVKKSTLSAYEHQMYSFDRLVEDLDLKYDMTRSPIFDISVSFHNITDNTQLGTLDKEDVSVVKDLGITKCKNDIEVHFQEVEGKLSFVLKYNEDVYEKSMIECFMNHYKQLLISLLNNTQDKIGSINYLSNNEISEQISGFNQTELPYPKKNTLVSLFKKQVNLNPNKTAVSFNGKTLSYSELDKISNQLSKCLITDYGIEKGDFIGVQLDRSESYIISILGILKSGAAFIPIDPALPELRKTHIVDDTNLKLLITETSFMFDMDYYEGELFAIDVEFEPSNYDETKLENVVIPTDLAYVIYTSGSTGKPKGVMIEHKGIVNTMLSQIDQFELDSSYNGLQFASFSFDASIWEIFLILLSGGNLFMIDQEKRKDPKSLEEYINNNNINIATIPPSYFKMMNMKSLSGIKTLITAGESPVFDKVMEYAELGTYYNAYGPTETSICGSVFKMETKDVLVGENIPIGKPITNAKIYVLDKSNRLQPKGVLGEICIGGEGVARGYLNLPELTKEKFIKNPFVKGERLYKTGDLGAWLPNGDLIFHGRKDDQIKINGFRIELGEIEHLLLAKEKIREAIVLVNEDANRNKELVAYIVSDQAENTIDLRGFLSQNLPDYMLPNHFVQLDNMPLTSNGKVDKKRLPVIEVENVSTGTEYVAAETKEEKVLVSVWEDVLKRESISVKDSFYNLGGDSIKSIQVVSRLKQKGYTIKVEQLLRKPVLEDVAKLMEINDNIIDQSEVKGDVELTPIQHYFFEASTIKIPHHYNQSVALKINEQIDPDILEKCLGKLVEHHDVLRMTYSNDNGIQKQCNKGIDSKHYSVDFYDLQDKEDALEIMAQVSETIQSSIDLEKGPLLKIGHFRLCDGDRLALILHHLVVDGVSWRILLEDLSTTYNQCLKNEKLCLPLKTDSFQKWAHLQKEYAHELYNTSEKTYWEEICKKSIPNLPTDRERTVNFIEHNGRASFILDEATTELLQTKVHGVYNTEINDVLLTSLGLAIKEVFQLDKSVIKMEGHGREEIINNIDISRTVGWFTSVYPFVLDLSNVDSNKNGLIKVKEDLRRIPNKGIGYGMLKYLTSGLKSSITPSIIFNYLGDFGSKAGNSNDSLFDYANEDIGRSVDAKNGTDVLLDVSGMMVTNQLTMSIRFPKAIYHQETIDLLIEAYKKQLVSLIEDLSIDDSKNITPSDLTVKGLGFNELKNIQLKGDVEDVYELSPLQQGMYYHWLTEKSTSMYFEQVSYGIKYNALDVTSIRQAYDGLVNRHGILRTSFTNDFAGKPLQIVWKNTESTFSYEKVARQFTDENERTEYIDSIKSEDRLEGFDLEQPCQMRLKVLDFGNGSYEFIWSHHHILMDGWCISILINDFYKIQSSLAKDESFTLGSPVNYSKYIEWLNKINKKESLDYWNTYLSGYSNSTIIPFRKEIKNLSSYKQTKTSFKVEDELYQKLNVVCQNSSITENTFVQGVWGYLLSRYNNVKDVVFGSVVSGRPAELTGVEDMIGLFINTIPVRVEYSNTQTPIDLLSDLQQKATSSNSHHYLNLSEVQSQSELGMDLMDHIVVFENYPVQETIQDDFEDLQDYESDTLKLESLDVYEQTNYDFRIVIAPSQTALSIEFRFNENVYSIEDMNTIKEHFYNLIEQFVISSNQPLNTLTYFSQKENSLFSKINKTNVSYEADKTIVDLFQEQVEVTPENIAIVSGSKEITYKVLNEYSNSVASYLIDKRKGDDFTIGVELSDEPYLTLIGILGVMKSGGAYTIIDSKLPPSRVDFILEDSKCSEFVKSKEILSLIQESNKYNKRNLNLDYDSSNLAYLIYTSGTTGVPKGSQIEHKSIVNYNNWFTKEYKITSKDSSIVSSSMSFDVIYTSLYGTILNGGTLHFLDELIQKDPEKVSKYILNKKITFLKFTPTYLNLLLNNSGEYNIKNSLDLRLILTGGERQNLKDVKEIVENTNIQLVNSYGPSETTVAVCTFQITKDNLKEYLVSPVIGDPIYNNEIFILDSFMIPQPAGVIGEICIGGVGLSRGYLNHLELTSEKFVKNQYLKGKRIYRTGDLGRRLKNGTIEFIGRADDQIKIRGYRIELGEIEKCLLSNENIREVKVVSKTTKSGNKELIAYLVSEKEFNRKDLREFLLDKLPEYMIPSNFVELDKMPYTKNGKVDKKILLEQYTTNISSGAKYVKPETKEEQELIEVLKEVLNCDIIGIKDDFYTLGGNSIKSVELIARLKQKGYVLKLGDLLNTPMVIDLAKKIKFVGSLSNEGIAVSPRKWVIGDEINLSKNQFRFFRSKYSQVRLSTFIKDFDKNTFENQFRKYLSMFPSLCIKYKKEKGEIVQSYISSDMVPLKIKVKRASLFSDSKLTSFFLEPFNLLEGELIRVLILSNYNKYGDAKVLLGIHHSLLDDYTANKVQEGLKQFFENLNFNTQKLDTSNFDFVTWQNKFLKSEEGYIQREYWKKSMRRLQDVEKTIKSERGLLSYVTQKITITDSKLESIKQISEKYRLPISILFLSSYQRLLDELSLNDKYLIGVNVNGREQKIKGLEVSDLMGVVDNLLPLHYRKSTKDFNKLYLEDVYEKYVSARLNQKVPFEIIREDYLQAYQKDIEDYMVGRFNFKERAQIKRFDNQDNKIIVDQQKGDWLDTVNIACTVYSNAIEVSLICSKEIHKNKSDSLRLKDLIDVVLGLNQLICE
ncbi:non-ribosomal peptide synthetase [uncultured Aquimarina sp.]|uniref:non-ribosomal peptide synthetase n=1 Tax=uncultured Aquimarina sp. TaxID=575652 RepID=UPI002626BA76|nr:non-ribosomal peptide synthetase [uncultured Aquimarina sp.]